VRAMPNTASLIRESMTVIGSTTPPLPAQTMGLVTWIFKRIGEVVYLPPSTMDACTALCGSGPAFFALMLEAAIDGAVAMGLPRAEAQRMAAQTMRGTAGLVLNGDHPALLRDKVSTPGGCTIGGLLVLEEGRVRGTVARAVREATVVASQLGKGVQGVNGTRFSSPHME
jgi:pyrroline-5-carboxylate reductase